ncbi:MAG: signal peptidase I [Minisyncoccia bacterium]
MKYIFNLTYYIFVVCIIAIAVLLLSTLIPFPGNFKVKVVKSGSMEPALKTGGIIFIRPSDSYDVGDIVTFGKDTKTQIPTTHRIISVDGSSPLRAFMTKGDANDAEDPVPIHLSDISGKVIFSVPYLGYVLDFAKRPLGFILLVGVPALVVIFEEIGKIIGEVRSIRRKKLSNVTR